MSFIGISILIFRKIPVLAKLPQAVLSETRKKDIILNFAKIIKNSAFLKKFSGELFLQKALSKIRVLVLKIDNKTFHWLQKLREKAQKNKFGENDTYWKEIKNSAGESPENSVAKRQRKKRPPE